MHDTQAMAGRTDATRRFIVFGLAYGLAFGCFFWLFQGLTLAPAVNTLQLHIEAARNLAEGARRTPEPAYHSVLILLDSVFGVPYEYGAAYTLSSVCLLSLSLLHLLILRETAGRIPSELAFVLAAAVLFSSAIYLPGVSTSFYQGTGSVSVWQNSTMLFVRPIGLLAFIGFLWAFTAPAPARPLQALAVGLLGALTVPAKPNFVLVFLPAAAVYMLLRRMWKPRDVLSGLLLAGPSLLVLGLQFFFFFGAGADEGHSRSLAFDHFGLWATKFPNVPLAIILTLALPLMVAVFRMPRLLTNVPLQLAWLMTVFGILERGLLKEGSHTRSGNWSWGLMIALTYVFTFTLTELVQWVDEEDGRRARLAQGLCCALLAAHLLSGVAFFLSWTDS